MNGQARSCRFEKADGTPSRAAPLRGGEYCFWHSPERSAEVAEAGRLGGLRRRRERTLAAAFDFEGLGAVSPIRRILEIAVFDTLSLENSVARSRTLAYLAQIALKALEVGELEQRLTALEATVEDRVRTVA